MNEQSKEKLERVAMAIYGSGHKLPWDELSGPLFDNTKESYRQMAQAAITALSQEDGLEELRGLSDAALQGEWVEEDGGLIAPDEALATGAPWVAVSVHHACRPFITACVNYVRAKLKERSNV